MMNVNYLYLTVNSMHAGQLKLPVVWLGKNLHCPEDTLNLHSPGCAGGVKLAVGEGMVVEGQPHMYISIS